MSRKREKLIMREMEKEINKKDRNRQKWQGILLFNERLR